MFVVLCFEISGLQDTRDQLQDRIKELRLELQEARNSSDITDKIEEIMKNSSNFFVVVSKVQMMPIWKEVPILCFCFGGELFLGTFLFRKKMWEFPPKVRKKGCCLKAWHKIRYNFSNEYQIYMSEKKFKSIVLFLQFFCLFQRYPHTSQPHFHSFEFCGRFGIKTSILWKTKLTIMLNLVTK